MDEHELYVESFSGEPKERTPVDNLSTIENKFIESPKPVQEMAYYVDKLERLINQDYKDWEDFQPIFAKIRVKMREKSLEEMIDLFNRLEELVDLGFPSVLLQRNTSS
jgi:hypothetical protein